MSQSEESIRPHSFNDKQICRYCHCSLVFLKAIDSLECDKTLPAEVLPDLGDTPRVEIVRSNEGQKFDDSKVPLQLLPTEALWEIGKVLKLGSNKYGDWNWKSGMKWSRLYGATLRHLLAWAERESQDPESSLSHLAHAACNILFLLVYEKLNLGEDDRWTNDG